MIYTKFTRTSAYTTAWITWEIQIRNRSMASLLNIPLYELIAHKRRIFRYPLLIYKTLQTIYKHDVRVLFVQNPSIVLSMLAILLCSIRNMKVVVDAHNSGIYPLEGRSKILSLMAKFIACNADAVIVSNHYLAAEVRKWGATPMVMPDPLPSLDLTNRMDDKKLFLLFICTWAADEPYLEIIESARQLNIDIYITGKHHNKLSQTQLDNLPGNIKLLGFVSDEEYVAYFSACLMAIDLTTRDNCLVCGAYEALAMKKPCIISDSKVNREIFSSGFIYSYNNANSIASAIEFGLKNLDQLNMDIEMQAKSHRSLIDKQALKLKTDLQSWLPTL